eukprot:UN20038
MSKIITKESHDDVRYGVGKPYNLYFQFEKIFAIRTHP